MIRDHRVCIILGPYKNKGGIKTGENNFRCAPFPFLSLKRTYPKSTIHAFRKLLFGVRTVIVYFYFSKNSNLR